MIPKIIIQTGKDNNHNNSIRAAMQTWKDLNPKYEYKYFTDKDCDEFILKNFHKDVRLAFNLLKPGAMKADLFRYCLLYVKGGIYLDIKTKLIKPIDKIFDLDSKNTMYTVIDRLGINEDGIGSFYQGIILTPKGNEIFLELINVSSNLVD